MEAAREWVQTIDTSCFVGLRGLVVRLATGEQTQVWVDLATENEFLVDAQSATGIEVGDVVVAEFYGSTYRGLVNGSVFSRNQRQIGIRPMSFTKIAKAAESPRVRVCGFSARVKGHSVFKTAEIENISTDGVCMVCFTQYELGDRLELHINSPFASLMVHGEVKWVEKDSADIRNIRHGVRLIFDSAKDERTWTDTIKSRVKI
jgi:hypothetical protein